MSLIFKIFLTIFIISIFVWILIISSVDYYNIFIGHIITSIFLSIFYAHSCSIFFLKYCFNHGFSTMSIKHTGSFFTKSGISTYYSVYLVSSQSLQASQAFSDP